MRIARVTPLLSRAEDDGAPSDGRARLAGEGTPRLLGDPMLALERDGALYDVAMLEALHRTRFRPGAFAQPGDFRARVVALGCAGLRDLDESLRRGDRPTEARLLPGSFLWLPPCCVETAACVYVAAYAAPDPRGAGGGWAAAGAPAPSFESGDEPAFWMGHTRALAGHDALVAFPAREREPDFRLGVAAVLADDVHRATAEQAERAILGYSVVNDWTARGEGAKTVAGSDASAATGEATPCAPAKVFATQLGPVLVTKDEVGDPASLRACAMVDGAAFEASPIGAWRWSLAECVAYASQFVELRAGDVIASGCVPQGSGRSHGIRLAFGARVELAVERLGRLCGKPVRGTEIGPWRR